MKASYNSSQDRIQLLVLLSIALLVTHASAAGPKGTRLPRDETQKEWQDIADVFAKSYKEHVQSAFDRQADYSRLTLPTDGSGLYGVQQSQSNPERERMLQLAKEGSEAALTALRRNRFISKQTGVEAAKSWNPEEQEQEPAKKETAEETTERQRDTDTQISAPQTTAKTSQRLPRGKSNRGPKKKSGHRGSTSRLPGTFKRRLKIRSLDKMRNDWQDIASDLAQYYKDRVQNAHDKQHEHHRRVFHEDKGDPMGMGLPNLHPNNIERLKMRHPNFGNPQGSSSAPLQKSKFSSKEPGDGDNQMTGTKPKPSPQQRTTNAKLSPKNRKFWPRSATVPTRVRSTNWEIDG